jgi:hypothetical protein
VKEKFYWIHRHYDSYGLNSIAQRLVEYHTANLLQHFDVYYVNENLNYKNYAEVGTIFLDSDYKVTDLAIINSLMNYNVYFKQNTEAPVMLREPINGLDFIVSLAAGDLEDARLKKLTRYIIDISPLAIEKSKEYLDVPLTNFYQLDIFDIIQVKHFLKSVEGTTGLLCLSNCFLYMPSCILYDVMLRLRKQNEFIKCLQDDSRTWYVNMISATGDHYYNVNVKDIPEITNDNRFRFLPWID